MTSFKITGSGCCIPSVVKNNDIFLNHTFYDENGSIVMPHNQFTKINNLHNFLIYQHKKYFKFYNCQECANFIVYYDEKYDNNFIKTNFETFDDITSNHIKYIYYKLLLCIENQELYKEIIENYKIYNKNKKFYISPELTTKSAHTLTNGPTLYMTNNIEKVSKYLLHISSILF